MNIPQLRVAKIQLDLEESKEIASVNLKYEPILSELLDELAIRYLLVLCLAVCAV